nr:DUF4847 family protein [uncultured Bacteroides sp.]
MKTKYLCFLILLFPLLSGCNDTDDIAKIFLGKTWKLTNIMEGDAPSDYWNGNQAAGEASLALIRQGDNCTIKFNGTITENIIIGTIAGTATSTTFNGKWRADGENRTFSSSTNTTTDSDVLGRAFLNGLNNATSYSGDENNLYIYFKEGQRTKYLLFRVQK